MDATIVILMPVIFIPNLPIFATKSGHNQIIPIWVNIRRGICTAGAYGAVEPVRYIGYTTTSPALRGR